MYTKYNEVIDEIKDQLAQGLLIAGSKLPSVRQLSEKFSCSKNTVVKAYEELEKEHLIFQFPKAAIILSMNFKIQTVK